MAQYVNKTGSAGATLTTLGTVPANRSWIVKSLIAAHSGDKSGTLSGSALIVDSTNGTSALANAVSVASATAVNLLAGTTVLTAGQVLKIQNASAGVNSTKVGSATLLAGVPTGLIANSAGTTLIAPTAAAGIFRSTDEGATWTRVYALAIAVISYTYVSATSTFYIYTSATTALKSTDDGLTWSAQATTLAPVGTGVINPADRIVKVGSTYYGANTTTQFVSSTDGVTWANSGVVLPAGTINMFCWSGTNWVVASNNVAGIYYSTNMAAWTAVSLGGLTITSVGTNGAGVVVGFPASGVIYYSTNHGAAFTASTVSASSSGAFYTGTYIACGSGHYVDPASPSLPIAVAGGSYTITVNQVAVTATKVYGFINQVLYRTSDYSNAKYGVDFTAHIMEEVAS